MGGMPEAVSPKLFKLLPVPMRLDGPRWRASWHLKRCTVWHISEIPARAPAGRHFQVRAVRGGILLGNPGSAQSLSLAEKTMVSTRPLVV